MNHRHYIAVLPGGHCYRCHQSYEDRWEHQKSCPTKEKDPTLLGCAECREGGRWGSKPTCPLCGK